MGRDGQNRFRLWRRLSDAAPGVCVAILEDGIHRIAVTKKDRGEYRSHV